MNMLPSIAAQAFAGASYPVQHPVKFVTDLKDDSLELIENVQDYRAGTLAKSEKLSGKFASLIFRVGGLIVLGSSVGFVAVALSSSSAAALAIAAIVKGALGAVVGGQFISLGEKFREMCISGPWTGSSWGNQGNWDKETHSTNTWIEQRRRVAPRTYIYDVQGTREQSILVEGIVQEKNSFTYKTKTFYQTLPEGQRSDQSGYTVVQELSDPQAYLTGLHLPECHVGFADELSQLDNL